MWYVHCVQYNSAVIDLSYTVSIELIIMQVPLKRMFCYRSQIHQQCQRSYCLIIISILFTQIFTVRPQGISTYYVSSSSTNGDGWCSMHNQHPCFNLTEVATSMVSGRFTSNLSFILAPGNHYLLTNLTIAGHTHFLLKSEDSQQPAIINCGESSQIQIHSSTYVHIHGIILNGCVENEVHAVKNLTIEASTFSAIGMTNVSGRALTITNSTVIILQSAFKYFTRPMTLKPRGQGGVILAIQGDVLISNSMFFMNLAGSGGVMYCVGNTILINNSTFTNNSAIRGGVLYIEQSGNTMNTNSSLFQERLSQWDYHTILKTDVMSIFCISSNFTMNIASKGGVIYMFGKTEYNSRYTSHLQLERSNFAFNKGTIGAVFMIGLNTTVCIHNCTFQKNKANNKGGVGYISQSILLINRSTFSCNQAKYSAGVLLLGRNSGAVINSSNFDSNVVVQNGHSSHFTYGAIVIYKSYIIFNGSLFNHNNNSVLSLIHSTGHFAGYTLLKENIGSVYLYGSHIAISGHLTIIKQQSCNTLEGGCMTLHFSTVTVMITGRVMINDSIATNGGGILSILSVVDVKGTLTVSNNTAKDTGGGIYLYLSQLYVQGLVHLQGNIANTFGGGIHCISSTIVLLHASNCSIKSVYNAAIHGGGICLEASSKFYMEQLPGDLRYPLCYIENSANYGGAIYVADNTTTGTCTSTKVQTVTTSLQTECFVQFAKAKRTTAYVYPPIGNCFYFNKNLAKVSGANLYGGLLDRCTVYSSGRNVQYSTIVKSILNLTSSEPVQVCLCASKNNKPKSIVMNCTHTPPPMRVVKGNNHTLQIAAVDHMKHRVNAMIYSILESRNGYIGEGQQKQRIEATCTSLNFSIISPVRDHDHLVLYADGPCKDLGISALRIPINFDPCSCPTGFEPESEIKDRCVCRCHHVLKRIFPDIECNSKTLLIIRNHDFWFSTTQKGTLQYFITYKQCPSDYCHPSTTSVYINLNNSLGGNTQCAFNHIGVLCGHCQPNLTLSLGSSRCIECPHLWPAITLAILVGAFLAGLSLVALILVLNLTVASGTLNGVIFYANIITIDQQLFMPFERPNFHSIFIAWLNLDIGFDVCFFKGLNAYAKAWLQLTFPLYIILIVVAVIVGSHYSKKFANYISRKNPVATLATLILLSYAKLLHNIIEIFSYAILRYTAEDESDSFTRVVWLYDGSIGYLNGIHTPLFIVAILIVIIGSIYTFLFLFWQCLVKLSDRAVFHWVRNTKLSSFMDAYHAPYMARNRYWTGLLLLARVILYLTAAINVSGEPSVNLLAILVVIGCISLLHAYSGISIYKKWPLNVLEYTTYFNILVFTAAKFYIQMVGDNHAAIAYASISVQFALFVFSLLHHIVLECHILVKVVKQTICRYKSRFSRNLSIPLLENDVQYTAPTQMVTYSEVAIKNPEIQLTSGMDSEREGLSLLLSTENGQF